MFGQRVTLFRLLGLEVRANTSWVLLAVLVFWSLATGLLPHQLPGLGHVSYWLLALVGTIGVFFSLLFHEFAHALVARSHGMRIEGITLFLFGGVAEMTEEPPDPRTELRVAAAGPIASGVLFVSFWVLAGLVAALTPAEPLVALLGYLALINLILALFNLFPGFPLDGGRILRAWLWQRHGNLLRATRTASRSGQGFGMALVVLGFWALISVGALGGLWWILIGIFVIGIARAAYDQTAARNAFEGTPIGRFMTHRPVTVEPAMSLGDFVEDVAYVHHYSVFPVVEGGRLIGLIRTRDVRQVPREAWPNTPLRSIMQAPAPEQLAERQDDADQVLQRMQRSQSGQVIVVEDQQPIGVVTLRDMLEHLAVRQELGADR